jgi:hypothetical protein
VLVNLTRIAAARANGRRSVSSASSLPNQKSEIINRQSSIDKRYAADRKNRLAVLRAKIRRESAGIL